PGVADLGKTGSKAALSDMSSESLRATRLTFLILALTHGTRQFLRSGLHSGFRRAHSGLAQPLPPPPGGNHGYTGWYASQHPFSRCSTKRANSAMQAKQFAQHACHTVWPISYESIVERSVDSIGQVPIHSPQWPHDTNILTPRSCCMNMHNLS